MGGKDSGERRPIVWEEEGDQGAQGGEGVNEGSGVFHIKIP